MDNKKIFENGRRLSLPDFSIQEKFVEKMIVYPPNGVEVDDWYINFRTRFFEALDNNKKFPIFRSSHGEFCFVTGKMGSPFGLKNKIRFYLSRIYRILLFQSSFYSSGVPGHGYETYKQWRLHFLRKKLAKQLKWISENGMLCMYFSDRAAFPISVQKKYIKWLNSNNIFLTNDNYGHLYFVYALLNGSDQQRIFTGRRLLVVSSDQPARTQPLLDNLKKMGTNVVDFISISPGKSMEDELTFDNNKVYDLCIVGAGVGAANIIYQLRDLNCPIIDAGFIIDKIAYPDKVKSRIYTINDELWPTVFPNNDPEWGPIFSDKYSYTNLK